MRCVFRVFRRLLIVVVGIVAAIAAVSAAMATAMVIGMRRKSAPVLDVVRRFNHDVVNPELMKTAGSAGSSTAVVEHVGRSTGTSYATPVQVIETVDGSGFVIALPYDMHADWLKNVLAAGSATLVVDGNRHVVDQPRVLPIDDVDASFPAADRRAHRLFAVERCVRLRRADTEQSSDEPLSA